MLIFVAILCCWNFAGAQRMIKGAVIDSLSGKPVAAASVYFNGSRSGTVTDAKGLFTIASPSQPQLLIVSNVGYKTIALPTNDIQPDQLLTVKMTIKSADLDAVTVRSLKYKPANTRYWKKKFIDYFIGPRDKTADCSILNFDDIALKVSANEEVLKAQSKKTIEIVNHWLGYRIYFDMEDCTINFEKKTFVNFGYARFEDIGKGDTKFKERRDAVYQGSLPHFLKSLYSNTLQSNNFEARRARVRRNTERDRVRQLMKEQKFDLNFHAETLQIGKSPSDSSLYYYRVYVKGKDQVIECDSSLLHVDDVFVTDLEVVKELYFEDYLLVTYKKEVSDQLRLFPLLQGLELNGSYQNSLLSLKDNNSVFVFANGAASPASVLTAQGYWYAASSIKNLLPYDY
ncbi:carboxypeptidase-like regulatory domain-containing protein [Niabella aurantiaca]|uniref:carboxypeptidase-like regulatory domain-containing protein n=1 Tax=Niabella aurantiaca TaxID=379900 RepID=UPI0003649615|nr:carboxypeptidase-like regulatory domain-containing protein [Niabella aurantiaca]